MEEEKQKRRRKEERMIEGNFSGNGDVMTCSSSRRTMWLQCTDFHLHKAGWSSHSRHTV